MTAQADDELWSAIATRAMAELAAQWDRRLATIKRLAETGHAETRRGDRHEG